MSIVNKYKLYLNNSRILIIKLFNEYINYGNDNT